MPPVEHIMFYLRASERALGLAADAPLPEIKNEWIATAVGFIDNACRLLQPFTTKGR